MPEVKIKFVGDDAEEVKEAFFDWMGIDGIDRFDTYCCNECQIELDADKITVDGNTITVRT